MALVESFVRFARDVGATVCAEGIESLDELAVIADLDVEWGQGYALARPAEPWAGVPPGGRRALPLGARRGLPLDAGRAPPGRRRRPPPGAPERAAGRRTRPRRPRGRAALIAAELGARTVGPLGVALDAARARDAGRDRRTPAAAAVRDRRVPADRAGARRAGGGAGDGRRPRQRPERGRAAARARGAVAADGPGRPPRREPRPDRGLPRGRARLDADRDQPRADHREPVRLRDPDAGRRAGSDRRARAIRASAERETRA